MEDERLVTELLVKFSDPDDGWVCIKRDTSLLPVTEFVRAFEAFIVDTQDYFPRRFRRNFGLLRRTIIRCLDSWNAERSRLVSTPSEMVPVEVTGDQLRNVEFVSGRARTGGANRRFETVRKAPALQPPRGGISKPVRSRPRRPLNREFPNMEDSRREVPMTGEIVIGNEFAGAILGRKGATIQSIRQRSGGYVHLSESMDGQTRMIEVRGGESQVMEAHRQVNQILHREYPNYFQKGIMVPMKTTIELKMSIELASFLTGVNRTELGTIQTTTGIAATLHDIDGDERSKLVRLTGSFDKILDAYNAVHGVLDTYESYMHRNSAAPPPEEPIRQNPPIMNQLNTAQPTGEVLQLSIALVKQPDGSYKQTQVYLPQPVITPAAPTGVPVAGATMPSTGITTPPHETGGLTFTMPTAPVPRVVHSTPQPLFTTERNTVRPARAIGNVHLQQRELQIAPVYPPSMTSTILPSIQNDQGQVIVLPAAPEVAPTANVYYPATVETPSSGQTLLHHKGVPPPPY